MRKNSIMTSSFEKQNTTIPEKGDKKSENYVKELATNNKNVEQIYSDHSLDELLQFIKEQLEKLKYFIYPKE